MRNFRCSISLNKVLLLLILAMLSLAACQQDDNGNNTLADALPLDQQKPTFIFFYTDG